MADTTRTQEREDARNDIDLDDVKKRRKADFVDADGNFDEKAFTDAQYEAAYEAATTAIQGELAHKKARQGSIAHIGLVAAMLAVLLGGIWTLNGMFAPELYERDFLEDVAEAFDNDRNFGVHDLNIDIRTLRDAHIARLDRTPEVALLGASHWQEADMKLLPGYDAYNAHIHRDYYEDPLAMIEMFERHGKLPKTLILTIRDNQFTPVAKRTDFLWLPGIPYYRTMATRLGLEFHHPVETAPVEIWKDRLSMPILFNNVRRMLQTDEVPGATTASKSRALDILLPDGSIVWSDKHDNLFTQERARREALEFAASKKNNPPMIDPKGVRTIETLLDYLDRKGVRVYLAHPPFNPLYWEAVQGTPYMDGLAKVKAVVQGWADKYGWDVIGGFDPSKIGPGCRADQYIDAEHSNRTCLKGIFDQFMALHEPRRERAGPTEVPAIDEPASAESVPVAALPRKLPAGVPLFRGSLN